eukprot:TRINITY_DN11770_c0_g1_i1.p1 TRINITY_DN11770_c0_g1~~TRINITY_DN11770_c0_g1_i1.p1  ORF type:complete len:178 (+),score=23.92 TRINITY_DN11770_c0_g1_i1:24-536(+)
MAYKQNDPYDPSPWGYGICECFSDCGIFCDVYWCSCCMAGNLFEAVVNNEPRTPNYPMSCLMVMGGFFSWFLGGTAVFPLCCGIMYIRNKMRDKYYIKGSILEDCLCSLCCGLCVMCQLVKESSRHNMNPGHICCGPSKVYAPPVAVQPAYTVDHSTQAKLESESEPEKV